MPDLSLPRVGIVNKFGYNEAIGTSFEPMAVGGIYRTPQVAGATKLRVKAGNANDTAAGSGARKVVLQGLNASGEHIFEEVSTNGTSAGTASNQSFLRLFRAYVSESGTYATSSAGSHAANVVIENAAGTQDWATIAVNSFPMGQSEIGAYTVPRGYYATLVDLNIYIESNKPGDLVLFRRDNVLKTSAPYDAMRTVKRFDGVSDRVSPRMELGITFDELTDFGFMAKMATSGTGSVDFDFRLVRKT